MPRKAPPPRATPEITDDADQRAMYELCPLIHFENYIEILDRTNAAKKPVGSPLQQRIDECYRLHLAANEGAGEACYMVVLKGRQQGSSTFCAQIVRNHLRLFKLEALMLADTYERTGKIWALFTGPLVGDKERGLKRDEFPWLDQRGNRITFRRNSARQDDPPHAGDEGWFSNGSHIETATGEDPNAGISGTRQVVWVSELGRFPKDGVKADHKTVGAISGSFAKQGNRSLFIKESTAEGATGDFYRTWKKGITIEEWKAGKRGYVKIFAGWWEEPEYVLKLSKVQRQAMIDSLQDGSEWQNRDPEQFAREREGMENLGWTLEQVAWRRHTIENEYNGNVRMFDQEFPARPNDAFLASGGFPRFDSSGVHAAQQQAELADTVLVKGTITVHEDETTGAKKATFAQSYGVDTNANGPPWVFRWEEPRVRSRYLISVDIKAGLLADGVDEMDADEMDRDRHSVLVHRGEELDPDTGAVRLHEIVARVKPPCYVDDDVLADYIDALSHYYGRCLVVPEANTGNSLIPKLLERGVPVSRRMIPDPKTGELRKALGWWNDQYTRRDVIDSLAVLIRKRLIKINCTHLADELQTFIVNAKGKAIADSGCHDDDVISAAIGVHHIAGATEYKPWTRRRGLPQDGWERVNKPRRRIGGKRRW